MIKCFPVSNIAVIYYKQAVRLYTNWSGCYQLLWHFILILKINLETGKKVQNYCFKQPVRAYLQSGRGSIVFRETAHSLGMKFVAGTLGCLEQFPTWVLRAASRHSTHPCPGALSLLLAPCSREDLPVHLKPQTHFKRQFRIPLKTNKNITFSLVNTGLAFACGVSALVCFTAENKRRLLTFWRFFLDWETKGEVPMKIEI